MKIKESKENLSLKKLPLLFFIGTAAALVLRTVQMFKFIDHETGFSTGGGVLTALLFAVIAVFCVAFIVISFLSAESSEIDFTFGKNTSLGAVSLVFALSFLYDSMSSVISSADSVGSSSGASAFQALMLSGTLPLLLRSLFAFLSALYFFIFTKSLFKGDIRFSRHKLLALAPVGWAGFRMIHRFIEQISFIKISDLLLELILLALMILFFMSFAQVASGVYVNGFRWRITGLGFSSALIALSLNGARLIFTLVSGSESVNPDYPYVLSDFVFSLFTLILCVNLIKGEKSPGITEGE